MDTVNWQCCNHPVFQLSLLTSPQTTRGFKKHRIHIWVPNCNHMPGCQTAITCQTFINFPMACNFYIKCFLLIQQLQKRSPLTLLDLPVTTDWAWRLNKMSDRMNNWNCDIHLMLIKVKVMKGRKWNYSIFFTITLKAAKKKKKTERVMFC